MNNKQLDILERMQLHGLNLATITVFSDRQGRGKLGLTDNQFYQVLTNFISEIKT